jgi:hypothetical protein
VFELFTLTSVATSYIGDQIKNMMTELSHTVRKDGMLYVVGIDEDKDIQLPDTTVDGYFILGFTEYGDNYKPTILISPNSSFQFYSLVYCVLSKLNTSYFARVLEKGTGIKKKVSNLFTTALFLEEKLNEYWDKKT